MTLWLKQILSYSHMLFSGVRVLHNLLIAEVFTQSRVAKLRVCLFKYCSKESYVRMGFNVHAFKVSYALSDAPLIARLLY